MEKPRKFIDLLSANVRLWKQQFLRKILTTKIIFLGFFIFNLFFYETAFSNNNYKSLRATFENKYSVLYPLQVPLAFAWSTKELNYSGTCFLNSSDPGVSFQINATPITRNGYHDYDLNLTSEDEKLRNASADPLELEGEHKTSPIPVLFTNYTNLNEKEVELRLAQWRSPYPHQPVETASIIARIQINIPFWPDDIYVCRLSPVENS